MKNLFVRSITFLFLVLLLAACSGVTSLEKEAVISEVMEGLKTDFNKGDFLSAKPKYSQIESFEIDDINNTIVIRTNKRFSNQFFREDIVEKIYSEFENYLAMQNQNYSIKIYSLGFPIEELIPNFYRTKTLIDESRKRKIDDNRQISVVRNISKPYKPEAGLFNNNIALWHSHGWYYNHKLDRWTWQRARLFQIVEDLGPMAFTVPYIIPMLENAGANVYVPRERDLQLNEVVIDNDVDSSSIKYAGEWFQGKGKGFNKGNLKYESGHNPFTKGTHLVSKTDLKTTSFVEYIPEIPEEGEYGVYISYNDSTANVNDARYTVYHTGGKTEFHINQQIGGNTWIYLGSFKFNKGINPKQGKVMLDNKSATPGRLISADAVRFGGGMGVIVRNGNTSGKPKYIEGARYWLQYAGMPDTLVFNLNGDSLDYRDDYQSRGEWVNYLIGNPFGPNKNRSVKGLGIPVDLSIAFHTDAGITENDSTIGTLAIYSLRDVEGNIKFPDSTSRLANRDFTDLVQTQIVEDIKVKYDSIWNRRDLRDALYSEAARPNVPSVLLELLSHQNFLDNKFQLDPRFRFDVSRSIYKAALKFIADQNDREYVVQPLPVSHFNTSINNDGNIKLKWRPVTDPLEETAVPDKYIVYRRINENEFDNGTLVQDTTFVFEDTEPRVIYGFKITAVNEGGESFPSEILTACSFKNNEEPLLIINAFDRVSGPASVNTEKFSGFLNNIDEGVPYKYDLSFTGVQHNFDPTKKWLTDDMPGHGASYANYESKVIAGNTFDYSYSHGKAIFNSGYQFVSTSDEAVWDKDIDIKKYPFIDLICGEEKETDWPKDYTDSMLGKQFKIFPDSFKTVIKNYLENGGNLFLSGSYIGSDLFRYNSSETKDPEFAKNILGYKLSAEHAVKKGKVYSHNNEIFPEDFMFEFNTQLNNKIYAVEAPNAISPANENKAIIRYAENDFDAGTLFKKNYSVVAFGFPFETIIGKEKRNIIMKSIIDYLLAK